MFNFFATKNQKLVKRWHREHEKIVELAQQVSTEYTRNDHKAAKKHLKQLNDLTVSHVMSEDIELFRLVHDSDDIDAATEEMVQRFVETFRPTKLALMDFLMHYSKPEVPLDQEFFKKFNEIVEAVGKRIDFEEKNVYSKLKEK